MRFPLEHKANPDETLRVLAILHKDSLRRLTMCLQIDSRREPEEAK
jgi:hypothetical protein